MLSGRVPFEADTFNGDMTKHMYVSPTPLGDLVSGADLGALEDLTLRCLEKKPERRFQSMAELIEALSSAGHVASGRFVARPGQPARVPTASVLGDLSRSRRPAEERRAPARRWSIAVGAFVVLFAFAVLAGWSLRATPGPAPGSMAPTGTPPAGVAVSVVASRPAEPGSTTVPETTTSVPRVERTGAPSASRRPPARQPARAEAAPPRRKAATSAQPAKIKRQFRSGEIIDPWSQ
jgi:serine/threonine protein kinase